MAKQTLNFGHPPFEQIEIRHLISVNPEGFQYITVTFDDFLDGTGALAAGAHLDHDLRYITVVNMILF